MSIIQVGPDPAAAVELPATLRSVQRDDIGAVRAELDSYYQELKVFATPRAGLEIREVLQRLAAFSARASELRTLLVRTDVRAYQALRTKEVEPFLEEIDRQFRVWSRMQSIREHEWDMAKGF